MIHFYAKSLRARNQPHNAQRTTKSQRQTKTNEPTKNIMMDETNKMSSSHNNIHFSTPLQLPSSSSTNNHHHQLNNKRKREEGDSYEIESDNRLTQQQQLSKSVFSESFKRKRLHSVDHHNKRWTYMPREALYLIMLHFSKSQLIPIAQTCKYWYNNSRVNLLWQSMNFQGFRVYNMNDVIGLMSTLFPKPVFQVPIQTIVLPKGCGLLDAAHFYQLRYLCPQLQEITLPVTKSLSESVDNAVLKELSLIPTLRRINMSTHTQITDEGLGYLALNCPNLTHVTLDHCRGVTTSAVINLMKTCPKMVKLSTVFCASCIFDSNSLMQLATCCSNLESASLEWGSVDSVKPIHAFAENAKRLKQLHLRGCAAITGECLSKLVSNLTELQQLTMICSDITRITAPVINSHSLKELSLSNCELLKDMVVDCTQLRKLHIDSIQSFRGVSIKSECNPNLTELILRSSTLEAFQPEQFMTNWPASVEIMEIFDCTGIDKLNVSSERMQELKLFMCTDIEELKVESGSLKKMSVDVCLQLRKSELHCDNLVDCKWFTMNQTQPPIMDTLSLKSKSLESLSLPKCVNLREVQLDCEELISINMSECKVLEALSCHCPKLQKLALSAPRINFTPNLVNDLALNCPEVNMLSIANIPSLTDDSLQQICMSWKKLNALIISNCAGLDKPIMHIPFVKGLQFCDCANLTSPKLFAPVLGKLFFKNDPNLSNDAVQQLTRVNVPSLRCLEITNCGIQRVLLAHSELLDVQLNACQELRELALYSHCTKLTRLLITDAKKLEHVGLLRQSEQAPPRIMSLADAMFNGCEALTDSLIHNFVQMCNALMSLLVIKCNQIQRPQINSRTVRQIQFTECINLVKPVMNCPALERLSFKVCPMLYFQDLAELLPGSERPVIVTQAPHQQAQQVQLQPQSNISMPTYFAPSLPPMQQMQPRLPFNRVVSAPPQQMIMMGRPALPHFMNQPRPDAPPQLPPNFQVGHFQPVQQARPQQFVPPQIVSVPNVTVKPTTSETRKLALLEIIKCDKVGKVHVSVQADKLVVEGCMRLEQLDINGTVSKLITNGCFNLKAISIPNGNATNLFVSQCPQLSQLNGHVTNTWITDCPRLAHLSNNLMRTQQRQ